MPTQFQPKMLNCFIPTAEGVDRFLAKKEELALLTKEEVIAYLGSCVVTQTLSSLEKKHKKSGKRSYSKATSNIMKLYKRVKSWELSLKQHVTNVIKGEVTIFDCLQIRQLNTRYTDKLQNLNSIY